jgi:putative restriction endonuclease
VADIVVNKEKYAIIDTLEYITLADSFVKNKIGSGHGEAKLYVGNENEKKLEFFGNFAVDCFFSKSDFKKYLKDAESEFLMPQQEYVKKEQMSEIYDSLIFTAEQFNEEVLPFELYRANVKPPRVYINAKSVYYEYMRNLALPNISYISILKLKNSSTGLIKYYFKIFVDFKSDLITYVMPREEEQEKQILENINTTKKEKENLINSRIGQGEYRRKLFSECPICPFTQVSDERMLVASHIKPWVFSDDKEKVDIKNGFMFTPTYERLFNRGFITFEDDKTLVVSPWISQMNQNRLGIYTGKIISLLQIDEKKKKYLEYHRDYIFKY